MEIDFCNKDKPSEIYCGNYRSFKITLNKLSLKIGLPSIIHIIMTDNKKDLQQKMFVHT